MIPTATRSTAIIRDLRARNARGERLEVVTVPSPGEVVDAAGNLLPASYMNFYIANTAVVVPTYGVPATIVRSPPCRRCFPVAARSACPAKPVVVGGGAFHCCTQQQPAATRGATP